MNNRSLLELRHVNNLISPVGKDIKVLEDIEFSAKKMKLSACSGDRVVANQRCYVSSRSDRANEW